MQDQQAAPLYRVWGADNIAYGPFELPALVPWIKQKRVLADSWVFVQEKRAWMAAADVPELKMFFAAKPTAGAEAAPAPAVASIRPENLRRVKIFAEMDAQKLESFLGYMEVVKVKKFTPLFHKGDIGDSMYFILEGQVRALTFIEGKETTLFTMGAGEAFGEIALITQGPRSADIAANEDSVLLKLPAAAFEKIVHEAPALAAPFLLAISRTITLRSLELGKKFERSIQSARTLSDLHL